MAGWTESAVTTPLPHQLTTPPPATAPPRGLIRFLPAPKLLATAAARPTRAGWTDQTAQVVPSVQGLPHRNSFPDRPEPRPPVCPTQFGTPFGPAVRRPGGAPDMSKLTLTLLPL